MLCFEDIPFEIVCDALVTRILQAPIVNVGEWQAIRTGIGADTAELEDVMLQFDIPQSSEDLRELVKPNVAWADEHFEERVGGYPVNPPPSHERWPYRQHGNEEHLKGGVFSHTYPERFWPREANGGENIGIRYRLGDLQDAITLLCERRHTRQVYIPIWFPEDLAAAVLGYRVPCSLGYHAMIRDGALSLRYAMRSCDLIRHFRDDVYLACRLAQWLAAIVEARTQLPTTTGKLVMSITSLHVFAPADLQLLAYRRTRTAR